MFHHQKFGSNATTLSVLSITMLLLSNLARADLIAYTSFEEPVGLYNTKYYDTSPKSTDHALLNNPGEPLVQWAPSAGDKELGFSSFYTNTRGRDGLTDGDYVGVTKLDNSIDSPQRFEMGDTDGRMTTYLESVNLADMSNTKLSLDIYINDTSWEAMDHIRIWLILNNTIEADLLNAMENGIGALSFKGEWHELSTTLLGYESARLAFSLDSSADGEKMFIDNIRFEGDIAPAPAPVPVPASGILAGLGLFYANWLRRRTRT